MGIQICSNKWAGGPVRKLLINLLMNHRPECIDILGKEIQVCSNEAPGVSIGHIFT